MLCIFRIIIEERQHDISYIILYILKAYDRSVDICNEFIHK